MSKTKRKRSSAGKSIAIFFIVFIILEGLLIFGLKTIFKNEDAAPSLGGYSFFLMDSDNMSPTVPKNTLVIAMNGTPSVDKIKSAVLCKNVGDEGTTVAWLTEIGSKGDTVDGVIYTVYQDNVVGQDSADNVRYYDVGSSDVVGVATSRYDTAGKIISFVITPFGMVICLAVPLVMLILLELVVAITNRSGDSSYEAEDYEDAPDYEDDEEEQQDNVSLDDFLYGGSEDEVYNNGGGKPTDDYTEEFEEKRSVPEESAPAPKPVKRKPGKPDFVLNIPEEDEGPDPFADDEDEQEDDTRVFGEAPANEIAEETAPEEQEVVRVPAQPTVDRKYYEKAAKLIEGDDYVPTPEPEPQPAPVQLEKPAPQPVQAAAPAAAPVPERTAAPERAAAPARRAPAQGAPRRRPAQQGGVPRRRPASGAPARQGSAQRRPRPTQARPAQRRTPHKDANKALEELMQKMAEEQKKLGGGE